MTAVAVIGIDPGPVPGIVVLRLDHTRDGVQMWSVDVQVAQCSASMAPLLLAALLTDLEQSLPGQQAHVAIETFVVGRRSSRSNAASAGAATRDLIGRLSEVTHRYPVVVPAGYWRTRTAAQVKPWATDARLAAAGLLEQVKGMPHAKDAARHALYCAVRDASLPDPLSRTPTTRST